jgi:hypothetical protein
MARTKAATKPTAPEPAETINVLFKLSPAEHRKARIASAYSDLSLTGWVRSVVLAALELEPNRENK